MLFEETLYESCRLSSTLYVVSRFSLSFGHVHDFSFSLISLMVLPPEPITMPIISGFILIIRIFGAFGEISFLEVEISFSMALSSVSLAFFACLNASPRIFTGTPSTLTSS